MTVYAYTDGAARGNPGESGIGLLLKDGHGKIIFEGSGYIGKATNNVAEYTALLTCIKKVRQLSCKRLIVYSDSELMVKQLRGEYRVKDKGLQTYFLQIKELLKQSPFSFEINHIEREKNRQADQLANIGIDTKQTLNV